MSVMGGWVGNLYFSKAARAKSELIPGRSRVITWGMGGLAGVIQGFEMCGRFISGLGELLLPYIPQRRVHPSYPLQSKVQNNP